MTLSTQLHLAVLSLSNTVSNLETFGAERARATVHDWVHKAELQPAGGRTPDHVAVDETVIQLDGERYWLYAAVDPDTSELPHRRRIRQVAEATSIPVEPLSRPARWRLRGGRPVRHDGL